MKSQTELDGQTETAAKSLEDLLLILDRGQGSGSGGLITEIVEFSQESFVGTEAEKAASVAGVNNETGAYSMVSGNSISTTLGAKFDHCFNPRITTTADMEGLVVEAIGLSDDESLGAETLENLVFGAGGFYNLNYGVNQNLNYGPAIRVQRGQVTEIKLGNFWEDWSEIEKEVHSDEGKTLLKSVHYASRSLAILAALFDIAVTIAMKWQMESPPSQSD